jgi:mannose-6-phosphate isomerase-like protein (cupin superfamily)
VWLVGDLITVKVGSEDTNGAFSIAEKRTPPQGGPPPHLHQQEGEVLYGLEGEVEFLVGERTIRADTGSCAYIPKRTLHTFKNVGTSPSRVLAILTPGGLDRFFLEAGEPATEGASAPDEEPDMGRIVKIDQKYGLEMPSPPGQ